MEMVLPAGSLRASVSWLILVFSAQARPSQLQYSLKAWALELSAWSGARFRRGLEPRRGPMEPLFRYFWGIRIWGFLGLCNYWKSSQVEPHEP